MENTELLAFSLTRNCLRPAFPHNFPFPFHIPCSHLFILYFPFHIPHSIFLKSIPIFLSLFYYKYIQRQTPTKIWSAYHENNFAWQLSIYRRTTALILKFTISSCFLDLLENWSLKKGRPWRFTVPSVRQYTKTVLALMLLVPRVNRSMARCSNFVFILECLENYSSYAWYNYSEHEYYI